MTDRQFAAEVAQHFSTIPAKNPVSPKKTAKKMATKATSGKRAKKPKKQFMRCGVSPSTHRMWHSRWMAAASRRCTAD
jgi:hypothetical protein